jgi:hypothetical protein
MKYIIEAEYINDYKIKIKFNDNTIKFINFENLLEGEVFKPLKDKSYFKNFRVNYDIDTIVWPNGADYSPDFLYQIGELVEN